MAANMTNDPWADLFKDGNLYPKPVVAGDKLELDWPAPPRKKIYPLFLPFMGCPNHCIFCAQDRQTGVAANIDALILQMRLCKERLQQRKPQNKVALELAFYGGTFTGLPDNIWNFCLAFAAEQLELGHISGFRCSTRPDFLNGDRLAQMKNAGCLLVELGVQTFNTQALHASGRNYDMPDCENAALAVANSGMRLGMQLMPGFPNAPDCQFPWDVNKAIALNADVLRFYPCLVFAGASLADWHAQGRYQALELEKAVALCAHGWLLARAKKVSVIRMGVADQDKLSGLILGGPTHTAFGNLVMAEALFRLISHIVLKNDLHKASLKLFLPIHAQGYFYGYKGNMSARWRKLHICKDNCRFWQRDKIVLALV